MNTDITRVYRIIITLGLGLAVGFLLCNRVVFAAPLDPCGNIHILCVETPAPHESIRNRALMMSAAGETHDGKLRTIKVDDEGHVILNPTSIDSTGALRAHVRTVCEIKIEAAMALIDPQIDPHDGDARPQQWLASISRTQWEAWQSVKRDCWSRP